MSRLQAEYLNEIPQRLEELRTVLSEYAKEQAGAGKRLHVLFHRLAGSAGAYGFGGVTDCCRTAEGMLQGPASPPEVTQQLKSLIEKIEETFAAGPTTFPIAP